MAIEPPRKNRWFEAEDPDTSPWMMLLSYVATVVVFAAVTGCVFAFGPYVYTMTERNSSHSTHDTTFLTEHDTTRGIAWRFWIGTGIGGAAVTAVLVGQNRKSGK